MRIVKKIYWVIILLTINIYSQSTLSLKLTDGEYLTKNIEIELVNNTNKKCVIPIDKTDFQPYSSKRVTSLKPLIEVKQNGRQVKFTNRFAELKENEIQIINEGKKLSGYIEKNEIIEIKPMEVFKIVIPFNPFSFNVKNYIYNSYQILFDKDYELKIYLKTKKSTCFGKIIESNVVTTRWKQ
ncbi:hypothetical protein JI747_016830 [Chryseobacterium sp. RG1]|uniref:Gingipain propeptide domain-containing protein n=1 Tax=Chryseobacterium tagetis TaxID=2801334 RepID=A0ABS8A4C1_9FLAO|nr:hypothetical protein [Chryseobacterium tagetis]MCA6068834.1 hypothetical protein [Chryseobacterium tagetis]